MDFGTLYRYLVIAIFLSIIAFVSMGCSVGTRFERGFVSRSNPHPYSETQNFQSESFLRLVVFIKTYHGTKPTDELVLTAQTYMVNAGMIRQCRKKDCYFVYENKEVIITPEYVQIRQKGSEDYVKYYNEEVAMKVIYGVK